MTGYDPSTVGPAGQAPPGQAAEPPAYHAGAGYPMPYPSPYPQPAGPTLGPAATSPGAAGVPGGPVGAVGPVSAPGAGGMPPGLPGGATGGRPAQRLSWLGVVALVLVFVLAGIVVFQARQIGQLDRDLDRAELRLSQEQAGDDVRMQALEARAGELEKQAGKVFNPESIASAVLPSVFRVAAGEFTGTAFAVGTSARGGGTNLFTNFHVVESVWNSGGRQVRLERSGESYPARIVRVDQVNDVAQLTTTSKFTGLVTAPAAVKSGQQIVVVGAPLGLEDSVTTGVVSAFRTLEDGSGTVIQFSAPINPGNSGGPVINGDKEVVGIATAKARDAEGIGLAVPIKTACDEFKIC